MKKPVDKGDCLRKGQEQSPTLRRISYEFGIADAGKMPFFSVVMRVVIEISAGQSAVESGCFEEGLHLSGEPVNK